jgi:hypothetical protein
LVFDNSDATKGLAFDVGTNVPTSSTVTLTVPAASGTIARTETFAAPPAIGNTTAAAGTFTTLTANNGTQTTSVPVLDLAQTWNASGTTFSALRVNVTNTNSAAASLLMDLQVGGTSRFAISRQGLFSILGTDGQYPTFDIQAAADASEGEVFRFRRIGAPFRYNSWVNRNVANVGSEQYMIFRISAGTGNNADQVDALTLTGQAWAGIGLKTPTANLTVANGANATTAHFYNTFTSATNHERGFLRWSSNVFQIGTEKGSGGGTARALEIRTDNVARINIGAAGEIGFFGAAAAAQPAAVADATDAASTQARLNDLLARLRTLGLIAT